MSLEIKEQSCPICKAYLFEDDEVAVCPTCGAPHHRECFVSLGHCGLEEFHGTDKQYDKAKKQNEAPKQEQKQEQEEKKELCPSCKKEVLNGSTFCNHCGAPLNQNNPYVIRIDYLGGVKPETDLGNGHKANDVKDFVAVSTNRIIPMFKRFKKGAKVAFSFWHLLFPAASFAMRKMYSFACLSGALEVAATLLMLPLNIVMGGIMQEHDVKNYYELAQYMVANMDKALMSNFILATVGIVVQLFNRSSIQAKPVQLKITCIRCGSIPGVHCVIPKMTKKKLDHFRPGGQINFLVEGFHGFSSMALTNTTGLVKPMVKCSCCKITFLLIAGCSLSAICFKSIYRS